RRPGAVPGEWATGVSGADGPSGEDPRIPDRVGGDRGSAGRLRGGAGKCSGDARGRGWGQEAGGVRGAGGRQDGGAGEEVFAGEAAGVHGSRSGGGDEEAAADAEREAGPQDIARAG